MNSDWLQRSRATMLNAIAHTLREPRPTFRHAVIPRNCVFWIWVLVFAFSLLIAIFWLDAEFFEFQSARARDVSREMWFYRQVTRLGESKWIVIISVVSALVLSTLDLSSFRRKSRLFLIGVYSDMNLFFWATTIPGILAFLLKSVIGRARPKLYDQWGAHHFELFAFERDMTSFPSGHATTFGATCMVLTLLFPRFWPIWLFIAVLGAFTRIMMLSHYPSDVVAGLAFGAGFALLVARWLARRGVMFRFDGGVLPLRKR